MSCSNRGVKNVDIKDTKRYLVSPESAMFCAHLSHFGMLKPLLILTLLTIISRYQLYCNFDNNQY